MRRVTFAAPALLAVLALAGLGAGLARGERTQQGKLVVSLDGAVSPRKLPRDHPAPVAVHLAGALRTTDGSALPRVRRVEVALAGPGALFTHGLPVCPRGRLRNTNNRQALAACRPALVGRGRLEAKVFVPGQAPFEIRTRLLAFNGRFRGRRTAVLVHAFASDPPTSIVLPFTVHHRPGAFPTVLIATLPRALGPWPHLARFQMTLSRRFSYRGRRRSYLSASCPAPPRFTAGFFSFARSTYSLAGGDQITTTIVRGCRVRR